MDVDIAIARTSEGGYVMSASAPQPRGGFFLFGVVLAAGLIISTNIAARTVRQIKLVNQTITVKGYAEKRITSDWGTWSGSFWSRSETLAEAYAKVEEDTGKVTRWLQEKGVKKDETSISSVDISTIYRKTEEGKKTNEIEGYSLSRAISVSSADVRLLSKIARESTILIKDGVKFNSHSPSYIYTKTDELKIEMLGLATADALRRAEMLAANSGSAVGKLRSARQGVFQITPAYSTDVSDYGRYDTSTIEKSIKAVVTVDYSIE